MQSYDQQIAQLKSKLHSYKAIEVPRAAVKALNNTMGLVKTRVISGVAKSVNVPQKEVRKRVYISRANPKKMRVRMRSYYRGVSAIRLNAKDSGLGGWKTRKGEVHRYKSGKARRASGVKASGGRRYAHAFIAVGASGNRHVFERQGSARMPLKVKRIQIKVAVDSISNKVADQVRKSEFERLLIHELKFRISKYEV